jgi:hypothetical protein
MGLDESAKNVRLTVEYSLRRRCGRRQRLRDHPQFARIEACTDTCALRRFGRLAHTRQDERLAVRERFHLARRRHPEADGFEIEGRNEPARMFGCALTRRFVRKPLANLTEVELR